MKSRITTLMMAIVFVITILNFSMIAPCATTEAESYITTAEIAAADADYYSEEYSDNKSQDPDLVINKTDNYAQFLRDANDEYLAYSNVKFGETDENVYVKGIRVTYAYTGTAATLRAWTPGDLVKEDATKSTISVSGAYLTDVNGSQYKTTNWKYLGTVKLPGVDVNGDGRCTTDDFVTKDFMFATPRMVEPTSNVVISAGNGFYLRSFSFIKCSENEVRDAYGTIPATTADAFPTDLVGANHDTTGVVFNRSEDDNNNNSVVFNSSVATRYIRFNDVDFGATAKWIGEVDLEYATNATTKEVYIYDVTGMTGDLSVVLGKLSVGEMEQTPLFTIKPTSTGSTTTYASNTFQTPMKELSGKRNLIVTTNNGEIRFRSIGFRFVKDGVNISNTLAGDTLTTSATSESEMKCTLITAVYNGDMLVASDLSGPVTLVSTPLTFGVDVSTLGAGTYTVKTFIWNNLTTLMPVVTNTTETIVIPDNQ